MKKKAEFKEMSKGVSLLRSENRELKEKVRKFLSNGVLDEQPYVDVVLKDRRESAVAAQGAPTRAADAIDDISLG